MKEFCVVLCAGALSIAMCSCASPSKTEVQADSSTTTVPVVRVTRQTLERDLTLAAEFRPYQEVNLHAKVAGFLQQISVDVGDHVRAGDLIAILEVPEMADEEAQADASQRRSESELVRARGELARARSIHDAAHVAYQRLADVAQARPNLIARQELDDALAKDKSAEAQVDSAAAAITSAEQQIHVAEASHQHIRTLQAYTRITAPFAGVITRRYADLGSMIQAGTSSSSQAMPVVTLSQVDRLRLVLAIPESAVSKVRAGLPIRIRVAAVGREFVGRVSRFSDRLQTATRTMETEVDVENPSGDLAPGMYAEARLLLDRRDNVLSLPVEAVTGAEDKASLFVVDSQKHLVSREVALGLETPDRREVLKGLSDGDLVVLGKSGSLHAGDVVEPREAQ
jgi:RND family efflux transporter MFP subunit